ncbi:hypothetical protein BWQ96_10030 [Gracilariopsis chorda]|uniref:Uncharacterized protein n=1 Tax=Gracilariopsis chorda TaxID=448386 RepID=A0A2V3IDW8_9FLOR|nr:hypothetical protein BWQ96_10030 [Gracilariopsis chorda]|eukprot:PXF40257.1 hypothetical protein BWQ96_10030 [Gracilariopsis chorda]
MADTRRNPRKGIQDRRDVTNTWQDWYFVLMTQKFSISRVMRKRKELFPSINGHLGQAKNGIWIAEHRYTLQIRVKA